MSFKLDVSKIDKSIDGSKKYVYQLSDHHYIESVYIPQSEETMFCISSQVGCPNKCRHCATRHISFKRDLLSCEIVDQFKIIASNEEVNKNIRILFMGMGEPLLNLNNVIAAMESFKTDHSVPFSNITISTSGIANKFKVIANLSDRPRLAISLHATTNSQRDSLMPINKIFNIDALARAAT